MLSNFNDALNDSTSQDNADSLDLVAAINHDTEWLDDKLMT
jgi:hypothetical protein